MRIEVYSDGSATTKDKPGGYGWVIIINGKFSFEGSGTIPNATNNDAELEGAIMGLAYLLKFLTVSGEDGPNPGLPFEATLVSDSQIVLGWVTGRYRFKQKDKKPKFDQLMYLTKRLSLKTRWVEGHSGDEWNERCDKLAGAARKSLLPPKPKKKKESGIGHRKEAIFNVWYKGKLKLIDLESGIVENHNETIHGKRGSKIEYKD